MPPVLGASTMDCTTQGSPSIAVLPPEGRAVLSESASVKSAQLLPASLLRVREWMFLPLL